MVVACCLHQHSSLQMRPGHSRPPCAPPVCCAVMPLPGLLACVLLLSAVAIMEPFWRRFLPGQNTWTSTRADQNKADQQVDAIAQASLHSALCHEHCPAVLLASTTRCMQLSECSCCHEWVCSHHAGQPAGIPCSIDSMRHSGSLPNELFEPSAASAVLLTLEGSCSCQRLEC